MRIVRAQPQRHALYQDYKIDDSHAQYWRYMQAYLKSSDASQGLQSDIDVAMANLPHEMVLNAYCDLIRTTFKKKIVPALAQVKPMVDNIVEVIKNLAEGLDRYQACYRRLHIKHDGITGAFQALVRSNIHDEFWHDAMQQWISKELNENRDETVIAFHKLTEHVGLSGMFEKALTKVVGTNLRQSLHDNFANSWSESVIEDVRTQTGARFIELLQAMQIGISSDTLDRILFDGLASLRIQELFDIIVDFPASAAALEDLKLCSKSADMRTSLVQEFLAQCRARLLHPGANTPDIITVYVSTIKVFLILDPPGVLLDKIARPIRKYLRERTDTIRCIIGSLLGEVDNELSLELSEEQMPEEVEDEDDPLWLPDPIDAAPDYAKNRASDIIGSLISIYENKDVFTRELQTLLADRLLAVTDYNIDQELRNLELLKIRFGDGMLSVCDVMLKDISDSRRIDALIHDDIAEKSSPGSVVHSTIISRLYWPNIKSSVLLPNTEKAESTTEAGFPVPEPLAQMFKHYAAEYSRHKAQRNLVFQKDLGHVRVKLELQDREFDMLVSPVHAACIHLFNDVDNLSLSGVQSRLNLSEVESRRTLSFWVKQGILAVSEDGTYSVLETAAVADSTQMHAMEDVVPELTMDDAADDEMSTYWNFIVGMLTNVGALDPDRIHSMLGMFAPSYDKSVEQLKSLLQRKTREGAVELKGGLYKLPAT